jgi:hypothetical protein
VTDDIGALPLVELRAERSRLQGDEDAVSYVRRVSQARLDLVRAEQAHRAAQDGKTVADELGEILGSHLTGGGTPRPPRPAEDFSDHPLAGRLEELCDEVGAVDPAELDDDGLQAYAAALADFEQQRSAERRVLFDRIDALSAELVRRYRDGEASVDGLLDDDG